MKIKDITNEAVRALAIQRVRENKLQDNSKLSDDEIYDLDISKFTSFIWQDTPEGEDYWDDVCKKNITSIPVYSNSNYPAPSEREKELEECLILLTDWDKKYPKSKIYSYSQAKIVDTELTEIVEKAKQLLKQLEQ